MPDRLLVRLRNLESTLDFISRASWCLVCGHFLLLVQDIYDHFIQQVRTAVADGGPVEQKFLFSNSAAGPGLGCENPLFKNLVHIDRDRPHRHRSVLRGTWSKLEQPIQEFLDMLVTGSRSFAKLLETSIKFQKAFSQELGV